jgi:hypothetical protein
VVSRLHEILPADVDVMVLADRGVGDQKLFAWLDTIGWGFIIRHRQNIAVACDGESKHAGEWVPPSGHARMLRDVGITHGKDASRLGGSQALEGHEGGVVPTRDEPAELGAATVIERYSRRFTIERRFGTLRTTSSG